jgi:four helix bundle protein
MYDLEDRTYQFAKDVAVLIKKIPKTTANIEYSKQVIRSSGSIGANYIEANESLSKKDFNVIVKICRKESQETSYWLRLLVETNDGDYCAIGKKLIQESDELKKAFSSIIEKSK